MKTPHVFVDSKYFGTAIAAVMLVALAGCRPEYTIDRNSQATPAVTPASPVPATPQKPPGFPTPERTFPQDPEMGGDQTADIPAEPPREERPRLSCLSRELVEADQAIFGSEAHAKYLAKKEYASAKTLNVIREVSVGTHLKRKFVYPDISITPRMATGGYPDEKGRAIRNKDHKIITQYIMLDFQGYLALHDIDEEGTYQLGLLSDDGAILEVFENGEWRRLVDNDSRHAVRMACAKKTVRMKHNAVLPYRLLYFQGPRNHIANLLLWRKVGRNFQDPECGKSGQFYFFDPETSTAKIPYHRMVERGWQIVPQKNLVVSTKSRDEHACFQLAKR